MTQLIQLADDQNTPTGIVRLVAEGEQDLIPRFTYLIADSPPHKFFLQVTASNRNLSRFSPHPFDTITLAQMLALVGDKGYAKDAIVSNVTYYEATVEAIIKDGNPETPFIRPTTGAIARLATTDQIKQCLALPDHPERARIGKLAHSGEMDVAIHVNRNVLDHHILVAGSTGSGKSHLLSNIAHASTSMGRCVILFDHKPDHQNHHAQNDDAPFPKSFTLDGPNYDGVRYWTLDSNDPNENAQMISARASDMDGAILAGTIFYRGGEETQAEIFEHIISVYRDENPVWKIGDLLEYIRGKSDGELSKRLYGEGGGTLHRGTMQAIRRKIVQPTRIPPFLDAQPRADALGKRKGTSTLDALFHPGLNVIRITENNARAYALFLDLLLRKASDIRSASLQEPSSEAPDVNVIIDEASDIFQAESKHLREAAASGLAEQIRKGRSLHIGYVISVQSAGDVPERIRNNLNTTIIGRHRNMAVLRDAFPIAKPEMLEQADKLNPGEMYISLFQVRSLLVCHMDLSPSKLTVSE